MRNHFYPIAFIVFITIGGCSKSNDGGSNTYTQIQPQGVQNSSFETTTGWHFLNSGSSYLPSEGESASGIANDSGFLPSNGLYYARLNSFSGIYRNAPAAGMYQDSIYLNHSNIMVFDYFFNGTIGAGNGSAYFLLLFDNDTLLYRAFDSSNTFPIQKLNDTIILPVTTKFGRLSVLLGAIGGLDSSFTPTISNIVFGIDNIRVK